MKSNVSVERSENMRRIRSKNTKIEIALRKALWHKGYRYRKNYEALPGKPDIVLTKQKIAIFCDSEFFHGKDWEILKPQLEHGKNGEFWIKKNFQKHVYQNTIMIQNVIAILVWAGGNTKEKMACEIVGINPIEFAELQVY